MNANKILELYANRDDDFWAWREAVEATGIDATLDALSYSRDRNALWYNEHTGSVEPLSDLIAYSCVGRNETADDQLREFAMVLENWLPQLSDPNPVIARSLALTETDVKRQLTEHLQSSIEASKTADAFVNQVHNQGGTLPDGGYRGYVRPGKMVVDLHDGREFIFSLRDIYQSAKREALQPALFAI